MTRLHNYWQLMHVRLVCVVAATALLGTPASLDGGQAQESLQKDPWSVYSWGLNSQNIYYPPSCHQLSYFSGSPLRFDLGGELGNWKPGSYTVETNVDILGSSEGHRIYQVLQHINLKSQAGEQEPVYCSGDWPKIGMKRLLVERHPNEFCMIFEEEGTVEPPCGEIVRIEPAKFVNMGEPVLLTYDPLVSNGGYAIDGAWVFDHGVPICLLSTGTTYDSTLQALEDILTPAFKHILPPGCELKRSLNIIDLEHFRILSALMPTDEGVDRSKCEGAVELELGIKNHKLVVEHERYRPQ